MIPARARYAALSLALAGALALIGAVRAAQPDREYRETLYVFGTLVEIVVYGQNKAAAEEAVAALGHQLGHLHRAWHAWRPGELEDLNAALAAGRAFRADDALANVLRHGQILSCESGGVFDPAIGGLVELWGFHADTPPEGAVPGRRAIDAWRAARPRMADLQIDGRVIRSANPAVQLDLGGYAKGAALDLAAAELRRRGIRDAVLNAGGDVNVIGTHGARPWRVAIRDPFAWGAVAAVSLKPGEVLYTSGNYERYFEQAGRRFAHILDPRSGAPVREIVSASVLATDGARADAAATALSVAGRAGWAETAARMGVQAALLITEDGTIYVTPAMKARLEPVGADFPAPLSVVPLPPRDARMQDAMAACARL